MKVLFVYPGFSRHSDDHPELLDVVPMNEYLGSPSLGIAALAALTPPEWAIEYRDDRREPADAPTDADLVALSFFTPAAGRALELARIFRSQGKRVVAGGIFPTVLPDEVSPHVDGLVMGEGEGVWSQVLEDAAAGRLSARYRGGSPLELGSLPLPDVDLYFDAETDAFKPDDYPVQVSRGCGLNCRACVLPMSMTKVLRMFPIEYVIGQLEKLAAAGKRACLTEDTGWFPGSRAHRILRRTLEHLARETNGCALSYIGISMPMILAAPAELLTLSRAAGVNMFYLVGGFDPISVRAFSGRAPRAFQKALDALSKVKDHGIEPYVSFLLGNDQDGPGTAERMLEFAHRAGLRKAEFAIFTPYPGTPAWRQMLEQERILTRDWRRYNDANVVFRPAQMKPDELLADYLYLWREFYRGRRAELTRLPVGERTIQF